MVAALSGEYQDWIGASFGMCTYQKNASQVDAHAHLSFVATSLGSPLVNAVALPCKLCLRPKRLITRGVRSCTRCRRRFENFCLDSRPDWQSWFAENVAPAVVFRVPEHPWACHDNVQIRLHPFMQSIHGPTMTTSRSGSVRSVRTSMGQQ